MSEPYYTVQPFGERWIVTHRLHGMTWLDCIDVDCATQAAAEREAARMNLQRMRDAQAERHDLAQLGARS